MRIVVSLIVLLAIALPANAQCANGTCQFPRLGVQVQFAQPLTVTPLPQVTPGVTVNPTAAQAAAIPQPMPRKHLFPRLRKLLGLPE